MRTGILGGTFDPIHIAHLHTAQCALHQLELDRVLVMPAGDPWQKADRRVTSDDHRLAMCRLAVGGVDGVEVDDREVVRDGPTYTIDTLHSFPDDEDLYLILGADAAARLDSWHRWKEVANRSVIAIAPRAGVMTPQFPGAVRIEMGLLEISGTDIRSRAESGRPYRFLVTAPVYDYIMANGLYRNHAERDKVEALEILEDPS